jgi:hypothetical protein
MAGALALLPWVHRHSPGILPDGPSGHVRIRADPAPTTASFHETRP